MNAYFTLILDRYHEERKVTAFSTFEVAEAAVYKWAGYHGYELGPTGDSSLDTGTSKYETTDKMVQVVIVGLQVVEQL